MSVLEQLAQELAALLSGPLPHPPGSAQVPYGNDGIIRVFNDMMSAEPEDEGEGSPDGEQVDWREASYRAGGVYPFVCSECCYFDPGTSTCELVVGPYEDGCVNAADTCRFFEPADPMFGGEPEGDKSSIGGSGGEPAGRPDSPAEPAEEEDD